MIAAFLLGVLIVGIPALYIHAWIAQDLRLKLEYTQRRLEHTTDLWLSNISGLDLPPREPS